MKRNFSSFGQFTIVEADLEEAQVSGIGGHIAPGLFVPISLNIGFSRIPAHEGVQFRTLDVKLCLAQSQAFTRAQIEVNRLISPEYHTSTERLTLEFPLGTDKIAGLERLRNGGDLKLRIEAMLVADQLFALNQKRLPGENAVWGFRQTHQLRLQEEVTIPRDAWISRVLPNVGYGSVHVFEFPAAPIESIASLKHSHAALVQAQERHRMGLYDDAVGKCRVALDPFFAPITEEDGKGGKKQVQRLKSSWEAKLGKAAYAWLDGAFDAVRYAGNPTHHSPNSHYDQLESQMILAVTAAVLAYAARVDNSASN